MTRPEEQIQRAGDIIIRLPGRPRGKGRHRYSTKDGMRRMHADAASLKYERELGKAGMAAWPRAPMTGPLAVRVIANMPIPKSWSKSLQFNARTGQLAHTTKPDADNILKMLDALNGIVWIDDAQITMASVEKRYSAEPELVVIVRQEGCWI